MSDVARTTWNKVMESHSGIKLELGPTDVDRFLGDPKRMSFFGSRYKFAAKMLRRCGSILDVGCGSGWGTLHLLHDTAAKSVHGVDFESSVIDHAIEKLMPAVRLARSDAHKLNFTCRDFMEFEFGKFDGIACIDVIEHVDPDRSGAFIAKLADTLNGAGIAIVGTPSKLAAEYGSAHSKIGHINLYSAETLAADLERSFRHVFMFSMNDEVVHTGFDKLAHYLLAVCVK